jgi:hypothetical protein
MLVFQTLVEKILLISFDLHFKKINEINKSLKIPSRRARGSGRNENMN